MADNFTSEKVSSGDQIFATDQDAGSSAHYPIGKLAHGALNTFNLTSTSSPLPVGIFGSNSSQPQFITTDSGTPPTFLIGNATTATVPVTLIGGNSGVEVNVGNQDTVFTQTGYVAPSTTFTQTSYVAPSTTITVSNIAGNDTVVTVTNPTDTTVTIAALSTTSKVQVKNDSGDAIFVRGLTNSVVDVLVTNTNVTVTNIADNDTTVTVTGYTSSVGLIGQSAAAGGLTAVTGALSSTQFDVMTAVGRLYGYAVFNPDTAANVFMKIYGENAAASTLGDAIAVMDIMVPFGGGANVSIPQGVTMSSGMSVTIAATAGSTVHDAPATAGVGTFWFAPST